MCVCNLRITSCVCVCVHVARFVNPISSVRVERETRVGRGLPASLPSWWGDFDGCLFCRACDWLGRMGIKLPPITRE